MHNHVTFLVLKINCNYLSLIFPIGSNLKTKYIHNQKLSQTACIIMYDFNRGMHMYTMMCRLYIAELYTQILFLPGI